MSVLIWAQNTKSWLSFSVCLFHIFFKHHFSSYWVTNGCDWKRHTNHKIQESIWFWFLFLLLLQIEVMNREFKNEMFDETKVNHNEKNMDRNAFIQLKRERKKDYLSVYLQIKSSLNRLKERGKNYKWKKEQSTASDCSNEYRFFVVYPFEWSLDNLIFLHVTSTHARMDARYARMSLYAYESFLFFSRSSVVTQSKSIQWIKRELW